MRAPRAPGPRCDAADDDGRGPGGGRGPLPAATPAAATPRVETLLAAAAAVPPLAAAPADAIRAGETPVANVRGQAGGADADAADATGRRNHRSRGAAPAMWRAMHGPRMPTRAAALAEALQLLGIDAGGQPPQNWWQRRPRSPRRMPRRLAAATPGVAKRRSPTPSAGAARAARPQSPHRRTRRPGWPRRCMCSAAIAAGRRRGCGWPRRPRLRSMR